MQAKVRGGRDYQPLIAVNGGPCWPSEPDYAQLENGAALEAEARDFESHWERAKAATRTLRVTRDFDFVVLGVGLGAVPYVCKEFIARDSRWREMAARVKTVATQAFQLWLSEDLQQLGWEPPPVTLSAFVKPFDTWSDMGQVVPARRLAAATPNHRLLLRRASRARRRRGLRGRRLLCCEPGESSQQRARLSGP